MNNTKITLSVTTTIDEPLWGKWRDLWKDSTNAHPFNTPEWLLVCKETFHIETFYIFMIKQQEKLVAILPLVKERRFGIPLFCSPGKKYLDRSTLLMKDNNTIPITTLLALLPSNQNYLFQEIPIPMGDTQSFPFFQRRSSLNPYIPLTQDPFQSLSSENRRKLFRLITQYKNRLSFHRFQGDTQALQLAIDIDKKSMKRQKGKSAFESDTDIQFYHQLLKHFPQTSMIDVLFFEDHPIAFSIGLQYGKMYHAYNTAFDSNFTYLRPGKVLLFYLLHTLQDNHIELFNFSRGQNELKSEFTKLATSQYDLFFSPHLTLKKWWETATTMYDQLLNNHSLYNTYCTLKKYTYR